MIYVDSSVVLAKLFAEKCQPLDEFWDQHLISSRLLEYETWNRIHARQLVDVLDGQIGKLLERIGLIELSPTALARALKPFQTPLRTLDTLHLATVEYLRQPGLEVALASFDERMVAAARALNIPIHEF